MAELLFAFAAGLSTAYLLWFAHREGKKRKVIQRTWCYCPSCQEDLCSQSGSLLCDNDAGVFYLCRCGHQSAWNFDLFPCPVLLHKDIPTPFQIRMSNG